MAESYSEKKNTNETNITNTIISLKKRKHLEVDSIQKKVSNPVKLDINSKVLSTEVQKKKKIKKNKKGKKKTRCSVHNCRKKIPAHLCNFYTCKCKFYFCSSHLHNHVCSFEHKKKNQIKLKMENKKIIPTIIQKI